jgi:ELWxxDGT repeat protein
VKDIRPGPFSSSPQNLINHNSTLFFLANDGISGNELWKSTGFSPGTAIAADINVGAGSSNPDDLTSGTTSLFFRATNGISGSELVTLNNPAPPAALLRSNFTPSQPAAVRVASPTFLTAISGPRLSVNMPID